MDKWSQLLGDDGPFTQRLKQFKPREVQQQLARGIAETLADKGVLVAEAGTGTGKTLAYLVPLFDGGHKALISTGTKNLQDQLFYRDIPVVAEALGYQPDVALLKGRANYLCRYRLDEAQMAGRGVKREWLPLLEQVRKWSLKTASGEVDDISDLPDEPVLRYLITSTPDNCLGKSCPAYEDCFVVRARRRAQQAQVVVVNHHLLLADLRLRDDGFGALLPEADAVVIDEAHQLPDTATRFFGDRVGSRQLKDLARTVRVESAKVQGAASTFEDLTSRLNSAVAKFRYAVDGAPPKGIWPPELPGVQGALAELELALADIDVALEALKGAETSLDACKPRVEQALQTLSTIGQDDPGDHVLWYELRQNGFEINRSPLSVSEDMERFRLEADAAWIYTSATLAVADQFDLFLQQMGIADAATLNLPSPFDYPNNTRLFLPPDMPEPASPQFAQGYLQQVIPLLNASQGNAFLLFTAHKNLQDIAGRLRQLTDFPLFVQGAASRNQLLEQFIQSDGGVLLGAQSFWEGVDVPGDALRLVVIDRLPFASPDDPLLAARIDYMKKSGANPFMQWQLPAAILALKQGAGRLIRGVSDKGVLAICDPRLRSKFYGKKFLENLPGMPPTEDLDEVLIFLEDIVSSRVV